LRTSLTCGLADTRPARTAVGMGDSYKSVRTETVSYMIVAVCDPSVKGGRPAS
jgi:hypothetical protein